MDVKIVKKLSDKNDYSRGLIVKRKFLTSMFN